MTDKLPEQPGRNGGHALQAQKKVHGAVRYKVVELSLVTDETLQDQLNHWTREGWQFESIHFVVRENSRRPSMAFVFFVQEQADGGEA